MSEFTIRLALFKSQYGSVITHKSDPADGNLLKYVQISEFQEVTFKPLPESEIIDKQLSALDEQERVLSEKYNAALEDIKTRKAQLLALPNLGEQ